MEDKIKEKIKKMPPSPGIYIFKDLEGTVLYVGKAVNLKKRVASYFQKSDLRPQISSMLSKINSVDYLVVGSELEALITETDFIKRYRPKYNIKMKDDKNYFFIKITKENFPQVIIARRIIKDGSSYYGPFTDSVKIKKTLKILRDIFTFRFCKKSPLKKNQRPCLNYHLGRCLAPCIGAVNQKDYEFIINLVKNFLVGKNEYIIKNIQKEMINASDNLNFEKAKSLKDCLTSINSVLEKQKVVSKKDDNKDIFGLAYGDNLTVIVLLQVRNGKIIGKENFIVEYPEKEEKKKVMSSFLKQYYKETSFIPKKIVLSVEIDKNEEHSVLTIIFGNYHKKNMFVYPKKGRIKSLIKMSEDNAREYLKQEQDQFINELQKIEMATAHIADVLGIEKIGKIECYDISNISGKFAVGSMVLFDSGVFKKSDYRKFNIELQEGPNDFAMIEEVITRRFSNINSSDQEFSSLPNLLLIDGGKGQLSSVKKALKIAGIKGIALASLAKKEETLFFYVKNDIRNYNFEKNSPAIYLLQNIRDEAHRFAIQHHRIVRGKQIRKSQLDNIYGIGPKTKKLLLEEFGSLDKIREANDELLIKLVGKDKFKKLRENI